MEALEHRQLLSASGASLGGVGVIGDSYADEFQFYAPDRSTAQNFVELLADDRTFNFGEFTTTIRVFDVIARSRASAVRRNPSDSFVAIKIGFEFTKRAMSANVTQ